MSEKYHFKKCEMLDKNIQICPFGCKNLKHRFTQICDAFFMIKAAVCVKMTGYKVVQNAGISLTKGACVTLEVKVYGNV